MRALKFLEPNNTEAASLAAEPMQFASDQVPKDALAMGCYDRVKGRIVHFQDPLGGRFEPLSAVAVYSLLEAR